VFDTHDPAKWRGTKVGDVVFLRDEPTIQACRADHMEIDPEKGKQYSVNRVRALKEQHGLGELLLVELECPETPGFSLVVKIVGEQMSFRVMWLLDSIPPGNRQTLLEADIRWLFDEPQQAEWKPRDLQWAHPQFTHSFKEGDEDVDVKFGLKPPGAVFYETPRDPAVEGLSPMMFVGVNEYLAETRYSLPELMIVEFGGEDSDNGGDVMVFTGYSVSLTEVNCI
jgi:hypothetical protein